MTRSHILAEEKKNLENEIARLCRARREAVQAGKNANALNLQVLRLKARLASL